MLAYHEFSEVPSRDIYCQTVSTFREQLEMLRCGGLLDPLAISFDDAHNSQVLYAAPALQAAGARGIFFATTSWIDQHRSTATWADLRALLAAGHTIASHGHTHCLLTHCSPEQLHGELCTSRALLEHKLGVSVTSISMPGGRWNVRVAEACAQAGYTTLYTSQPGERRRLAQWEGHGIDVVGRLIVRREVPVQTIERYARRDRATILRLRAEYLLKWAAKRGLGDQMYQTVWRKLLRKPISVAT